MNGHLFGVTRTYLQFSRLQTLDEWWHWGAIASVMVAIIAIVGFFYRRDSVELDRPLRWLLLFLRIVAFIGLLLFFFGLEKRSEELLVRTSRAVVLVDASQSMAITDQADTESQDASGTARIDKAVGVLEQDDGLIEALRANHDVTVYRCDEAQRPEEIAVYATTAVDEFAAQLKPSIGSFGEARRLMAVAGGLGLVAMVALVLAFLAPSLFRGGEGENWALLVGVVFMLAALVFAAVNSVRNPEYGFAELISGELSSRAIAVNQESTPNSTAQPQPVDLSGGLQTSGNLTRLGDALADIVEAERGGPIAGIALLTDGNSNAGLSLRDAGNLAAGASIPVFPIGIGDDRPPTNARVVDIEAPSRVFPGDGFKIKGYLQAFGFSGMSIPVRLTESAVEEAKDKTSGQSRPDGSDTLVDERLIRVESDGNVIAVEFEVEPQAEGDREYQIELVAPPSDVDSSDNLKSAIVRVVDRKTRVLLYAGGPTRDYRFVRNLCYRDPSVTVDVLLQSTTNAAAQEADQLLEEFPTTPESLFEYDAIIVFDADWDEVGEPQLKLLDQWVAEKAGGLVVIAGPVYTPEWTGRKRARPGDRILKALYPVQFYSGTSAVLGRNRYNAKQAWPLEITANGAALEHLQLVDEAAGVRDWSDFKGVYGYFPVRGIKPGATVLARFSNPDTKIEGEQPPFLAYHFYGAGRVYFIGSGEFWRLYELSEGVFERFYTQLIRFVSEGRLLRDSNRGVLMLDKERAAPGETIVIRCTLTDAQFNPAQLHTVEGSVVLPDNRRMPITLTPVDASGRPGNYLGQITLSAIGDYRVEIPVPDSPDFEILTKSLRLRVPDREIEHPQRNDAKLQELADLTGGSYFVGVDSARQPSGLVEQMVPQDQQTYVPGTPDRAFQQRLMWWYLALLCGALSLEWVVRRLNRLA